MLLLPLVLLIVILLTDSIVGFPLFIIVLTVAEEGACLYILLPFRPLEFRFHRNFRSNWPHSERSANVQTSLIRDTNVLGDNKYNYFVYIRLLLHTHTQVLFSGHKCRGTRENPWVLFLWRFTNSFVCLSNYSSLNGGCDEQLSLEIINGLLIFSPFLYLRHHTEPWSVNEFCVPIPTALKSLVSKMRILYVGLILQYVFSIQP